MTILLLRSLGKGYPPFVEGETQTVDDELGGTLVAAGLATEVAVIKAKTMTQTTSGKMTKLEKADVGPVADGK